MHKLDRTSVPAPACLANYRHGTNTWDHVSDVDKQKIREHLERLQGRRCAYCECDLDKFGNHVEHFRRKSSQLGVKLTFEWSNLFWSCSQSDCCGHYKDQDAGPYNPDDLIDPTVHDPEYYLHFIRDGSIRPRRGLNGADQFRATETLRVFGLDPEHGRLRKLREVRVRQYAQTYPDILEELILFTEDERREYLRAEIAATAHEPFATTIKHFLESLI